MYVKLEDWTAKFEKQKFLLTLKIEKSVTSFYSGKHKEESEEKDKKIKEDEIQTYVLVRM